MSEKLHEGEYRIEDPNRIIVCKSGKELMLSCPNTTAAHNDVVPCRFTCPRCYEEPVRSLNFGPGAGALRGTRLITCGQAFSNVED